MNVIVQKFGGTSVQSIERIQKVARIVAAGVRVGERPLVVASAMGHHTDELIGMARQLNASQIGRDLDMLLATGEQQSASLLSMAINALGVPAQALTGYQAGICTDSVFGSATITSIRRSGLSELLSRGIVPVVAGYQGATAQGGTTTLGRGGSDTTAVALAGEFDAHTCDIYTDVDGIYSADPRLCSGAARLDIVSAAQMLTYAIAGARVMSPSSLQTAIRLNVPIRVRSTFSPDDTGTLITGTDLMHSFCGVACEREQEVFVVQPPETLIDVEQLVRLIESLGERGVFAEVVRTPGTKNVSKVFLAVNTNHLHNTGELVPELASNLGMEASQRRALAKLSVVGCFPDVAAASHRALTTLVRADVCPMFYSVKDSRVSVLVASESASSAMNLLHEAFSPVSPVPDPTVLSHSMRF